MTLHQRLRLERPIAFFDLETTGISLSRDRIVEIAVIRIDPGGYQHTVVQRVDPQRPISPGASAVNGIRDADVAGMPTFRDLSHTVYELLEGCDLGGFNVARFDIPILVNEFKRAKIKFSADGRSVVDAMRIFHSLEQLPHRRLADAVQFYCGRDHEHAHQALDDVQATIDILCAQLDRYPDLPRDVGQLAAWRPKIKMWVDDGKRFAWYNGTAVVGFGKHQGKPLTAIAHDEPDYLLWMLQKDFPDSTKTIIRDALDGRFPIFTAEE